jgi:DHA3 family macrolide efflux protein-like MFS transporter
MATQFSVNDGIKWKKRFFSIWTGQAFSLLGSELVSFALVWYLTIETESATVLAISTLVALLPRIVLGPVFGSLVDRWNRRLTMIFADALVAVATIGLALLFAFDIVEVWHIYALLLVRSMAGSLHGVAMGASTSLMVPVEHLTRIQGFNQFLNGGLSVIAAPLGAVLLDVLPMQGVLAIDVVTAIIAIIPLVFADVPQPDRKPKTEGEKDSVWIDMKEGFSYMRTRTGLMVIVGMAMVINLVLTPASSLMSLLVREHFNGEAIQYGLFNSSFGLGVIGGSLLLGVWGGFKNKMATSMVGVFGIGAGILALGVLPENAFYIALAFGVLAGLTIPLANGGIGAVMQSTIAPEMQGRVMGLTNAGAAAMSPLGLLVAGPVADKFGIQVPFLVSGIIIVLMGIYGFMSPAVMNVEKEEAQPDLPGAVEPTSAD